MLVFPNYELGVDLKIVAPVLLKVLKLGVVCCFLKYHIVCIYWLLWVI